MMKYYNVSDAEIGVYSLYYTVAIILSVILQALNKSWVPYYYDYLSDNNKEELKLKTKNYIEIFTILSVGFLLIVRKVGYFMDDSSYWYGIDVIPIVVLSVFLHLYTSFL